MIDKGITRKIKRSIFICTSEFYGYDAIKMSENVYNALIKELSPILVHKSENGKIEKETLMGLEVFIDYDAKHDYFCLGTSRLFKTDNAYPFMDLEEQDAAD